MSDVEQVLLAVMAVWLVVLSFVLLLVVRQIGLLTVRLSFAAPHVPADDDGPDLGTELPTDVANAIAGHRAVQRIVFLSGTCSGCRTLAADFTPADHDTDDVVLIAGERGLAEAVGELLPQSARRVFEPDASRLANALKVESVPFGLRVAGGRVEAKAYLHSTADLARLNGAINVTNGGKPK